MKSPILFQNQPAIELTEGGDKVLVSPEHGARILQWQHEGREVITWPASADWNKILKVRGGNPILFPFVARHFVDGKNELWRDHDGTVRPMPQHGFARDAKFAVVEEPSENSLRMRLSDSDATRANYSFAFQFDVVVTLLPNSRLEIRFETTNKGSTSLPYYAGHHFYLAVPHQERAQWAIELPCASWGRQSPDGAILYEKATNDTLRLDDPAIIDRYQIQPTTSPITLLNTANHRHLRFELDHPGSAPWYAVITWTESPTSDFYCIEPWLGLPNAIHHGEGLRRIAAGETETATCILDASGW